METFEKDCVNIAFRYGAGRDDKPRAGDDLKRNRVNLHCAERALIRLPSWGYICQMCLDFRTPDRKWAFFKSDRDAAYTQLPIDPSRAHLALVTRRNPETSERIASP